MTELILSEKPSAGLRIAEALADTKPTKHLINKVPYYELIHKGKRILVGCAVGHLFTLAEKERTQSYPNFEIDWKASADVRKTSAFTRRYLNVLKRLSKEADSFTVACDYDTEGSVIGFNCIRFICKKDDARRMKFSTLTKDELIESYENASPHLDFPLIESGETRHFLDWLWGINNSKALISAIKSAGQFKILSSGRVQSPTLYLLTKREEEIKAFKPEPFWQLFALIQANKHLLKAIHKENKFWKKKEAEKVFDKCKNKDALVKKVTRKEFKTLPPAPFNVTSLQTGAYRLFGFSPQQTLRIAQSLYLSAYISYPRTSSEKLPAKIGYKKILNAITKIKEFESDAEKILSKKILRAFEGKRVDPAHVAIYPTSSQPKSLSALNDQERKIYSLIVKRFLSCFADPALRESMEIEFDINKEIFLVKGARTLQPGWISFYQPFAKFKEVILPGLKKGEIYKVKNLELKEDETKPPKRYTQGSIIAEMEKRGLGTRATRSNILQILYDRFYIEEKQIKVTKLGIAVAETLKKYVPNLVSEKLTKHFEKEMEQIREEKKKKEEVLDEAKKVLTKILAKFKKKEKEIGKGLLTAIKETQKESSVVGKCPNCKGNLRIMYSKKNKQYFLGCSNYPKCKTTYSLPYGLPKPTNKTCKECKSPEVLIIRAKKYPIAFCINPNCKLKEQWFKKLTNAK